MPTIEQNLERIANALEKIAAQGSSLASNVVSVVTSPADDKAEAEAAAAAEAAAKKAAADEKAAKDKAAKEAAAAKKAAEEAAAAKKAAEEEAAAAAALGSDDKPKSTATKDDVRKALQAYREIEGTPAMLEILKKHGSTTLNDLAEDQYDAVLASVS